MKLEGWNFVDLLLYTRRSFPESFSPLALLEPQKFFSNFWPCEAEAKSKYNLFESEKKNLSQEIIQTRQREFKLARAARKNIVRRESNKYIRTKLEAGIQENENPWKIIKRCFPDRGPPKPSEPTEIKGKKGKDLADYMAKFFYEKARLVSDEDIQSHSAIINIPLINIPLPPQSTEPVIQLSCESKFSGAGIVWHEEKALSRCWTRNIFP